MTTIAEIKAQNGTRIVRNAQVVIQKIYRNPVSWQEQEEKVTHEFKTDAAAIEFFDSMYTGIHNREEAAGNLKSGKRVGSKMGIVETETGKISMYVFSYYETRYNHFSMTGEEAQRLGYVCGAATGWNSV